MRATELRFIEVVGVGWLYSHVNKCYSVTTLSALANFGLDYFVYIAVT